ncbi:MAG: hypothetical protein ACREHG_00115, partial [Candidatus Saccharimonadales bacterium]
IIVSAHIVDRYGKRDPADKYSESVVVGEKLSIRDKIGENSLIYFDHVFKFEREDMGRSVRHTCQFNGEIARTAFPNLPNGKVDITGVNFYEKLMQKVNPSVPVLAK